MEFHLNIGQIKVNKLESAAAFTVGNNLLMGFTGASKTANGTSSVTGDHAALYTLSSSVDDRDAIDTPTWGADRAGR
ncbi:MAG: spore germination protein [Mycobacterium leprae]